MSDMNLAMLEGRLGRDPQIINTESGKIARFNVATTEHYKAGDDIKERTTWTPVAVYDKFKAEYVEKNLHKGSHVLVQGSIESHSYESEGQTKYATEVAVRPGKSLLKSLDAAVKSPSAEPAKEGLRTAAGNRQHQASAPAHNQ